MKPNTTNATPPTSLLRSRQEVAEGTMAFRFDKPPGWVFTAGQFLITKQSVNDGDIHAEEFSGY